MARALAAIEVFAHFCDAAGLSADEIDAVATSAIREATNSDDFLERARAARGLAIRVLSREEEARYGYLAAINSTTCATAPCSTSAAARCSSSRVADRLATRRATPGALGAVRMTERFLPDDGPAKRKQLDAPARARRAQSSSAPTWLTARATAHRRPRRHDAQPRRGGCSARSGVPVVRRPGLPHRARRARRPRRRASPRCPPPSAAASRASSPRAGTSILAGAVVIAAVLEAGGFDAHRGDRGRPARGHLLRARCSPTGPPLFDDVRRASVLNLAAQYDADAAHTRHVAGSRWACSTSWPPPACTRATRGARAARGPRRMLHDIGVAVDYDDHHKHSRYLILNAGLPGLHAARGRADRPGRALPPQGHARASARSRR